MEKMDKDKLIEVMAKAIYDRQEGLKGVWAPRSTGLCDVYYDTAEAALKALCKELPGIEDICSGDELIPSVLEVESEFYNQLKDIGNE